MKIITATDSETPQFQEHPLISLCFETSAELRKFATFVQACADKFETMGSDFDHEHFDGGSMPDIVIARLLT